jgi:hypothetical protein
MSSIETSVVSFHLDDVDPTTTEHKPMNPSSTATSTTVSVPPLSTSLSMVDIHHQIAQPQTLTFTQLCKQLDTQVGQAAVSNNMQTIQTCRQTRTNTHDSECRRRRRSIQ